MDKKFFVTLAMLFCISGVIAQSKKPMSFKKIKTTIVKQKILDIPAKTQTVDRESNREMYDNQNAAPQSSVGDMPSGFEVFSEYGKQGIKNYATNEVILKPKYISITKESQNSFQVSTENGNGIYNPVLKKMVVDTIYGYARTTFFQDENVNDGKNKFAITIQDRKLALYGLINSNYKIILEPIYDQIDKEQEFFRYYKNDLVGISFFDPSRTNIPMIYSNITDINSGKCFIAHIKNSFDLYNSGGALITSNNIKISNFYNNWEDKQIQMLHVENKDKKYGLYNSLLNKNQIPNVYENITDVFDEKFIVKKKNKFGVISIENEQLISFKYDTLRFYKPNKIDLIVLGSKSGKWGIISIKDTKLTKFVYNEIEEINGFFKAKVGSKYFILNALGQQITISSFDGVGEFHIGKAAVFNSNKFGYIDSSGTLVQEINQTNTANGFNNLTEAFYQFVVALKSKNDDALVEFSKKICVDSYTQILFERLGFDYRGFPYQMKARDITIEMVQDVYFKMILKFRNRLIANNELDSLKFIKLENDRLGYFEEKYKILGTEKRGILTTNNYTYEYQLGEMMYLDGFWKSFTDPR